MNKGQLIEAVQKTLGKDTTKAAAEGAVNAVLDTITKNVKKGPVQIIGFGTFAKVKRAAPTGSTPKPKSQLRSRLRHPLSSSLEQSSRLRSDRID